MEPKTANKDFIRGRIWVEAEDYAIARIQGEPSKSTFFRSGYFVHEYDRHGQFWLPLADRHVPDFHTSGTTEMSIEYFDNKVNDVSSNSTPQDENHKFERQVNDGSS